MKKYNGCLTCVAGLENQTDYYDAAQELVDLKSRGRLIHPNRKFFNFILHAEQCLNEFIDLPDCFNLTVEKILETHTFKFLCEEHSTSVLSYAIVYYTRMRLLQFCKQQNSQKDQKHVRLKKVSKLTNQ